MHAGFRCALVMAAFALLSIPRAHALPQPGQIWFELPPEPANVGRPYIVRVHMEVGATPVNNFDITIHFDPSELGLAFSGLDFSNVDIAPGRSLVQAGITDEFLLYRHSSTEPGSILVTRSGKKNLTGPWPLTGDIEFLKITFHPLKPVETATIEGNVAVLMSEFFETIGVPEVVPVAFPVVYRPLPVCTRVSCVLSGLGILLLGLHKIMKKQTALS